MENNGNITIPHKHREEVRAVYNPTRGTIGYEFLKNGTWVLDYTGLASDKREWVYGGNFDVPEGVPNK